MQLNIITEETVKVEIFGVDMTTIVNLTQQSRYNNWHIYFRAWVAPNICIPLRYLILKEMMHFYWQMKSIHKAGKESEC